MTDSKKLDLILSGMNEMKTDIQNLKTDMQEMKNDVQNLKADMQEMKNDVQNLKVDVQNLNANVHRLETNMQQMQADIVEIRQKVTRNELTIENELRVNIQRVAEGHLDLSRKLDECIRLSSETRDRQEMQDIYINMHDTKLKTL